MASFILLIVVFSIESLLLFLYACPLNNLFIASVFLDKYVGKFKLPNLEITKSKICLKYFPKYSNNFSLTSKLAFDTEL